VVVYSLTEQAIELVPVLAQISSWGTRHLPADDELCVARARVLAEGGPRRWEAYMDELREIHLGPGARRKPAPEGPTVGERMQAAYEAALQANA
jgi:hypothetical protein